MIKENDKFIRADGAEFYVSEITQYPTSKKVYVFYRLRKSGDYSYPYHDYSEAELFKLFKKAEK